MVLGKIQRLNKHRSAYCLLYAVVVVCFVCLCAPRKASAVESETGISITPAFINTELSDASPKYIAQISITNSFVADLPLAVELQAIDEIDGTLVPRGPLTGAFKDSVRLPAETIVVPARSTELFVVEIDNTTSLEPGGHYASLVFTQQDAGSQKKPASVYAGISIPLFVIKKGGEIRELKADIGASNRGLFRMPTTVPITFNNTGNIHVIPRASALLSDTSGLTVYGRGVANQQSFPLLPGKSLTSTINIERLEQSFWPKRLLLSVVYRVDGSSAVTEASTVFWYVPLRFTILLSVLVVVIIAVIMLYRGLGVHPRTGKTSRFHRRISSLLRKIRRRPRQPKAAMATPPSRHNNPPVVRTRIPVVIRESAVPKQSDAPALPVPVPQALPTEHIFEKAPPTASISHSATSLDRESAQETEPAKDAIEVVSQTTSPQTAQNEQVAAQIEKSAKKKSKKQPKSARKISKKVSKKSSTKKKAKTPQKA